MVSFTEENYLKEIFKIYYHTKEIVPANALAKELNLSAAAVSEMLLKLESKKLLTYKKYKGIDLTSKGNAMAISIIRKHRLWEYFLVEKLNFSWDQVHDIAEELEHINSVALIEKLDEFLGYPKFDPHGDPIPDKNGKFPLIKTIPLSNAKLHFEYEISGIEEHSKTFLSFCQEQGLKPKNKLKINAKNAYDGSMAITINGKIKTQLSELTAKKIFVKL
jgi:DtxR family transcriptional regulator, Mn-dependent transcriptional regulator